MRPRRLRGAANAGVRSCRPPNDRSVVLCRRLELDLEPDRRKAKRAFVLLHADQTAVVTEIVRSLTLVVWFLRLALGVEGERQAERPRERHAEAGGVVVDTGPSPQA